MCTTLCSKTLTAEGFAGRMLDVLNNSGLGLMISVGHRTGLFDSMAGAPFGTTQQIADNAGLNERYVREWLGAMTTGGIVMYDPEADTYQLPDDHAACLTRAASPNNMAVVTQFISVLAGVEDEIVGCFRNGGGVPYSAFPRFHDVMAEESDQTVVSGLLETILPLAPGLAQRLEAGATVLDVGCGRGHALMELAETFPASTFTGYDLSDDAIANARAEAGERGIKNLQFVQRDITAFAEPGAFDVVFAFDAIHDQKDPASVLAGIATSLKRDGVFLMQDIAGSSRVDKNVEGPLAPFIYTISCLHCMTVSLAQGGVGLGAAWGEELACDMLHDAGFVSVNVQKLEHDPINSFYVATLV